MKRVWHSWVLVVTAAAEALQPTAAEASVGANTAAAAATKTLGTRMATAGANGRQAVIVIAATPHRAAGRQQFADPAAMASKRLQQLQHAGVVGPGLALLLAGTVYTVGRSSYLRARFVTRRRKAGLSAPSSGSSSRVCSSRSGAEDARRSPRTKHRAGGRPVP